MSKRIVRSSKFRHVFGTAEKPDKCFANIKISKSPFESNMCAVNPKFLAIVLEAQGGGAFTVVRMDKCGRLDINAPKVAGHKAQVMDIQWNPFDNNVIASCSEDSSVKIWDIPDGGLTENIEKPRVSLEAHERKCSHIQWHPTASNVIASSGYDNVIFIWNIEEPSEPILALDTFFNDTIYSFDWNFDGSLIATTTKDKKLMVINPRTKEVVSEGNSHAGGKPSRVVFCGSSKKLFTTGYSKMSERQYALWESNDVTKPLTMENIDNGMGVLFPFWDEGTKMVYIVGKGDTQIRYFEITDESPYVFFLSMYQSNVPQRGVGVLPKQHVDYMHCEVMRFFKVQHTKGIVEPIAMTVPRKVRGWTWAKVL